jgi:hypothetical protein
MDDVKFRESKYLLHFVSILYFLLPALYSALGLWELVEDRRVRWQHILYSSRQIPTAQSELQRRWFQVTLQQVRQSFSSVLPK